MVNPGAFSGLCKEFLMGKKASYYAGVAGGYVQDALATIQRRYFKRFPVDLSHDIEPSAEHLAAVDDGAPEPEQEEPDEDKLSPEEYQEATKRLQARRELIVFQKGIKRWMAYQYMKDHELNDKDSGTQNPFAVLLQQLMGVSLQRLRQKTPSNVWQRTHCQEIEDEAKRRMNKDMLAGRKKKKLAPIRKSVAKEMFVVLSQQERDEWSQLAKDEHDAEVAKWKAELEGPASTTPADRQKCIQGLTQFVQPILDGICTVTGWKASLLAGGPEPAYGGRLNMISIHSGTIRGNVKMHFGRSEQVRYNKFLVPMYSDFLQKCYSPEECRERALPDSEGFECLAKLDMGSQNVKVDLIGLPTNGLYSFDKEPEEQEGPQTVDVEITSTSS
ncbi:hypothetical protein NLJ89_g11248 [Agrocybe chaxingu]|uniref:Uncharacterized protein n=1 Tax=Agrocybe chaxingu TaxID=84603 RepID=A0A9W8MPJ2_9AGAR|nr:hypothetical protein NLJ89_g11248 [Agrocybe chaxingu]